jgi:type IV pilus assembly protein PilE
MEKTAQRQDSPMRNSGFTLVELMIAVAILAIIAAVAMPIYNQYSMRTFRTEAQADLLNCAQGMERYAAMNFDYDGADAAFAAGTICNPESVRRNRYNFTVATGGGGDTFTLTATPINVMAGDGPMTYDNAGNRGWSRDGNASIDAGEDNWDE